MFADYLSKVKIFATEHKELLIKIGAATTGALLGGLIATIATSVQEEVTDEDVADLLEEDEEETELEENE